MILKVVSNHLYSRVYNQVLSLWFVTSSSVIKTVQVDQYANLPEVSPTREQRYSVTPKPITADADDDFGFNETSSFFVDAKNFDPETGTDKLKQGNTS